MAKECDFHSGSFCVPLRSTCSRRHRRHTAPQGRLRRGLLVVAAAGLLSVKLLAIDSSYCLSDCYGAFFATLPSCGTPTLAVASAAAAPLAYPHQQRANVGRDSGKDDQREEHLQQQRIGAGMERRSLGTMHGYPAGLFTTRTAFPPPLLVLQDETEDDESASSKADESDSEKNFTEVFRNYGSMFARLEKQLAAAERRAAQSVPEDDAGAIQDKAKEEEGKSRARIEGIEIRLPSVPAPAEEADLVTKKETGRQIAAGAAVQTASAEDEEETKEDAETHAASPSVDEAVNERGEVEEETEAGGRDKEVSAAASAEGRGTRWQNRKRWTDENAEERISARRKEKVRTQNAAPSRRRPQSSQTEEVEASSSIQTERRGKGMETADAGSNTRRGRARERERKEGEEGLRTARRRTEDRLKLWRKGRSIEREIMERERKVVAGRSRREKEAKSPEVRTRSRRGRKGQGDTGEGTTERKTRRREDRSNVREEEEDVHKESISREGDTHEGLLLEMRKKRGERGEGEELERTRMRTENRNERGEGEKEERRTQRTYQPEKMVASSALGRHQTDESFYEVRGNMENKMRRRDETEGFEQLHEGREGPVERRGRKDRRRYEGAQCKRDSGRHGRERLAEEEFEEFLEKEGRSEMKLRGTRREVQEDFTSVQRQGRQDQQLPRMEEAETHHTFRPRLVDEESERSARLPNHVHSHLQQQLQHIREPSSDENEEKGLRYGTQTDPHVFRSAGDLEDERPLGRQRERRRGAAAGAARAPAQQAKAARALRAAANSKRQKADYESYTSEEGYEEAETTRKKTQDKVGFSKKPQQKLLPLLRRGLHWVTYKPLHANKQQEDSGAVYTDTEFESDAGGTFVSFGGKRMERFTGSGEVAAPEEESSSSDVFYESLKGSHLRKKQLTPFDRVPLLLHKGEKRSRGQQGERRTKEVEESLASARSGRTRGGKTNAKEGEVPMKLRQKQQKKWGRRQHRDGSSTRISDSSGTITSSSKERGEEDSKKRQFFVKWPKPQQHQPLQIHSQFAPEHRRRFQSLESELSEEDEEEYGDSAFAGHDRYHRSRGDHVRGSRDMVHSPPIAKTLRQIAARVGRRLRQPLRVYRRGMKRTEEDREPLLPSPSPPQKLLYFHLPCRRTYAARRQHLAEEEQEQANASDTREDEHTVVSDGEDSWDLPTLQNRKSPHIDFTASSKEGATARRKRGYFVSTDGGRGERKLMRRFFERVQLGHQPSREVKLMEESINRGDRAVAVAEGRQRLKREGEAESETEGYKPAGAAAISREAAATAAYREAAAVAAHRKTAATAAAPAAAASEGGVPSVGGASEAAEAAEKREALVASDAAVTVEEKIEKEKARALEKALIQSARKAAVEVARKEALAQVKRRAMKWKEAQEEKTRREEELRMEQEKKQAEEKVVAKRDMSAAVTLMLGLLLLQQQRETLQQQQALLRATQEKWRPTSSSAKREPHMRSRASSATVAGKEEEKKKRRRQQQQQQKTRSPGETKEGGEEERTQRREGGHVFSASNVKEAATSFSPTAAMEAVNASAPAAALRNDQAPRAAAGSSSAEGNQTSSLHNLADAAQQPHTVQQQHMLQAAERAVGRGVDRTQNAAGTMKLRRITLDGQTSGYLLPVFTRTPSAAEVGSSSSFAEGARGPATAVRDTSPHIMSRRGPVLSPFPPSSPPSPPPVVSPYHAGREMTEAATLDSQYIRPPQQIYSHYHPAAGQHQQLQAVQQQAPPYDVLPKIKAVYPLLQHRAQQQLPQQQHEDISAYFQPYSRNAARSSFEEVLQPSLHDVSAASPPPHGLPRHGSPHLNGFYPSLRSLALSGARYSKRAKAAARKELQPRVRQRHPSPDKGVRLSSIVRQPQTSRAVASSTAAAATHRSSAAGRPAPAARAAPAVLLAPGASAPAAIRAAALRAAHSADFLRAAGAASRARKVGAFSPPSGSAAVPPRLHPAGKRPAGAGAAIPHTGPVRAGRVNRRRVLLRPTTPRAKGEEEDEEEEEIPAAVWNHRAWRRST